MLKYNGNIISNDKQIGQMNDLMGCLEFIEKIYYANITLSANDKKPIVINDEKLVAQIKNIKESNQTNEEKNNIIDKTLRESGHLDINYQRRTIIISFSLRNGSKEKTIVAIRFILSKPTAQMHSMVTDIWWSNKICTITTGSRATA